MSSRNSAKGLVTFKWEISNFGTNVYGNRFSFPSNNQIEFEPNCDPNHDIWRSKCGLLHLYLVRSNKNLLNVRYRVFILNANGDKIKTQERVVTFSIRLQRRYDGVFFMNRDYLLDPSNGFLVNGKLITYWEVEDIDSASKTIVIGSTVKLDLNRMSQDYQSLLESSKMSDAVLVVGDKELRVHKLILSTRLPVFAAMFVHSSTKEAQENRVEITDIEVDVLEQLIKYIYISKVKSLDQFAAELLVASDKCQLDSPKTICGQFLCTAITTESVSDLFLLAELHQATELNDKCCDIVTSN